MSWLTIFISRVAIPLKIHSPRICFWPLFPHKIHLTYCKQICHSRKFLDHDISPDQMISASFTCLNKKQKQIILSLTFKIISHVAGISKCVFISPYGLQKYIYSYRLIYSYSSNISCSFNNVLLCLYFLSHLISAFLCISIL